MWLKLPFFALSLLVSVGAAANPITVSGGGTVSFGCATWGCTAVPPGFPTAAVGDPFTFSITFEPSVPNLSDSPGGGSYDFGTATLDLTIGNAQFTAIDEAGGDVDFAFSPPFQQLTWQMGDTAAMPWRFRLVGGAPAGAWLTSTAWPTDLAGTLNADSVAFAGIYIDFYDGEDFAGLAAGDARPLTQVPVSPPPVAQTPEPATLVLLGTGLAAAAVRRRRRT